MSLPVSSTGRRPSNMKADWNRRAVADPLVAIACDEGKDEAHFWESGARDAVMMLDGIETLLQGWESVLEIGCGIGRILPTLARHFDRVYGVDVSGEMLR